MHRGLANLLVDNTNISRVDGENGVLEYRGYSIHDLVSHSTFEETAYLLLRGKLPNAAELSAFKSLIEKAWAAPGFILDLMHDLRHAHVTEALRTGVSALAMFTPSGGDELWRSGVSLIAQVPPTPGWRPGIPQ